MSMSQPQPTHASKAAADGGEKGKRHTISILVENKFGAFNRIAGMFAAKGYNIDSLSVGPTEDEGVSRMTIVTRGDDQIIEQITKQLNKLIDITVPEANAAGGTLVIPGRGRIADHAEVAYYRDMTFIIRDRIQDMITRKMTLAQVKAARPTRDWDARYGSTTGAWTTDMFVEAAYQSLRK